MMHPLAEMQVPPGAVAVHWFEQNAFALKDPAGRIVWVDPYFPRERPAARFVYPDPPLVESELPADLVLLTHDHSDHTHPETLARILAAWPAVQFAGPEESIRRIVQEAGVAASACTTLQPGRKVERLGIEMHAFYSKAPAGDPVAGIRPPDTTHLGFGLVMGARRIYVSGDNMRTLADQAALLKPIRRFAPELGLIVMHPTEGEFIDFDGATRLARALRLSAVVPAHYGCFAQRDYNPAGFVERLQAAGDPRPMLIPHNSTLLWPSRM